MWTFLAAEEPASLIVPDSVQKANLAEAVNKIVNMDFSTLFGSLIRESLWILVKVLIALAIYFIGRWLVRRFLRLIDVAMPEKVRTPSRGADFFVSRRPSSDRQNAPSRSTGTSCGKSRFLYPENGSFIHVSDNEPGNVRAGNEIWNDRQDSKQTKFQTP